MNSPNSRINLASLSGSFGLSGGFEMNSFGRFHAKNLLIPSSMSLMPEQM